MTSIPYDDLPLPTHQQRRPFVSLSSLHPNVASGPLAPAVASRIPRSGSHKKLNNHSHVQQQQQQQQQQPQQQQRSSSHKKPSWDSTNQDLTVHRLPMKKLLEKQLQMMSKETLCKIAGVEVPQERRELMTLTQKEKEKRKSMPNQSSSGIQNENRVMNDVDYYSSDIEEQPSPSGRSTPSPAARDRDRKRRVSAPIVMSAGGGVKPFVGGATKSTAAPPASLIPIRRRSVAPTTTVAPIPSVDDFTSSMSVAQPVSVEFQHESSSEAGSNQEVGTAMMRNQLETEDDEEADIHVTSHQQQPSTEISWLKPHELSPVLERTFENGGGGSSTEVTPEKDEIAKLNKEIRMAVDEQQQTSMFDDAIINGTDGTDNSTNLLHELRQSLDRHSGRNLAASIPAATTNQVQRELTNAAVATSSSTLNITSTSTSSLDSATATSLAPLLTRLLLHLSEQPEKSRKEQVFKQTIVESFASVAGKVRELKREVGRFGEVEKKMNELEKENRELKEKVQEQEQLLGMIMNRMGMNHNNAAVNKQQPVVPVVVTSASYDPSLYNHHHNYSRSVGPMNNVPIQQQPQIVLQSQQQQQSYSQQYQQLQQQHSQLQATSRSSSPPRPVIVSRASAQMQQQQQQAQPVRMSGDMQITGTMPSQAVMRARVVQSQPAQQQQQQPISFRSTLAHDEDAEDYDIEDHDQTINYGTDDVEELEMEEQPRSAVFLSPVAAPAPISRGSAFHAPQQQQQQQQRRHAHQTPLSPSEEDDAIQAARFEREANEARNRVANIGRR